MAGQAAGQFQRSMSSLNERGWVFVYRSELDPELDADLNWSGLGPNTEDFLEMSGILNIPVEMTSRSPQSANIGIHHDFNNGHALAFDLVWIDFSNFELSEFYFNGETILETDPTYEDITAVSSRL